MADERVCGGCTECCTLIAVPELEKATTTRCIYLRDKTPGCAIYSRRPDSCRSFACLWLSDPKLPEEWRPDRIHGVILGPHEDSMAALTLHEDPRYPGVAQAELRDLIRDTVSDGRRFVAVVTGDQAKILGHPDLLASLSHE